MSARKTIGIIGRGSIGERHTKNLLKMGHAVLCYDPNIEGCLHEPSELMDLVDAVVIASPTNTHVAYALQAMQYANMHIFVEKPIGATNEDASSLAEVFANGEEVDMVGNNLRFHEAVKVTRQWIADGMIGTPYTADFMVAQFNEKYTDPVLLNWGAHEIDLAHHLLGSGTVVNCAGNDKMANLTLLQEGGVLTSLHFDYLMRPEGRGFVIAGNKGRIICNLIERTVMVKKPSGSQMIHKCKDSFDQNYKDEMKAFIDLIDGKDVPHAATGRDGLYCLETILEAQKVMVRI